MDLITFFQQAQKLKRIKRTGWVQKNIPDPESVADHVFGVALLCAVVPLPAGIDRDKLIKMALVEDLSESVTGDIVGEHGTTVLPSAKDKIDEELVAVKDIFSTLGEEELLPLATEALELTTPTAKFLKQVDRLEMALQALAYEQEVSSNLQEFFENSGMHITDPGLRAYFEELLKRRS